MSAASTDSSEGDERTPLLPAGHDAAFPRYQLVVLCFASTTQAAAFFSIFSFVAQQIFDTGTVPASDVGFWSGLIESLFSLTQVCVMLPAGWLSDRIGRKPCLVGSLACLALGQVAYGFSTSVYMMVATRCISGIFASSAVNVRTMIAEKTDAQTMARGFSWHAFAGNLGIFLGPLIGGSLARPAFQYPALFGDVRFFLAYPYALPCLATGSLSLLASLLVALSVSETLEPASVRKTKEKVDTSLRSTLTHPGVPFVLATTAWTMMLGFAFTAVIPIFWFTPRHLGGFGWLPCQISIFFALTGATQAVWLLIVFPRLQRRWGTNAIWRRAAFSYPVGYTSLILIALARRHGLVDAAFYPLCIVFTLAGGAMALPFTATTMAINTIAPSPAVLGALNGLALTIISLVRTFAPALYASVYAFGVREQLLGGYLGLVVMVLVSAPLAPVLFWLPDAADSKPRPAVPEANARA